MMEKKAIRIVLAVFVLGVLAYLGLNFLNAKSVIINSFDVKPVRYVYIDMGTNNGDSILSFFGMDQNNYPKFLDQTLISEKEWIVYAFEANARFNEDIKDATRKVLAKQPKVKFNLFTETAVWTRNGHIKFFLDKVNAGASYWGSSLKEQHVDVISSNKVSVDVVCVDIVDILKQYNKNDFIVVKMDVEGAGNSQKAE